MVTSKGIELDEIELPTAIYCRISQQYAATEESLDSQERLDLGRCTERNYPAPPELIFREKDSGHETADDRAEPCGSGNSSVRAGSAEWFATTRTA